MKIYLDDERETPDGWIRVYWPDEAIELLKSGEVTAVSLDHDLGDDERGTGYDVLLWIEEQVAVHGFPVPEMRVHSANSAARKRMESAIQAIVRIRVSRILAATTKGRLLADIPSGRFRPFEEGCKPPKAGDIVIMDQGFTGPDGEPMGLIYGKDSSGKTVFEAEAYDQEIVPVPDDPDDAEFLAKHLNN